MKKILFLASIVIAATVIFSSCSKQNSKSSSKEPAEKVIIFNAGSLAYPLTKVKEAYEKLHPNVEIITEAAGSRMCARKISDLGQKCDIMMSADYSVIDSLLMPKYATWDIKFATNQMSVVYTDKSKYASEINSSNWYKILEKNDIICGHSNPNDDPCGYQTLLMLKLASVYYNEPQLYSKVEAKHEKGEGIIRPKETDLLGLLGTGEIDYIFIYKSIAVQHDLKYIQLPPEINLGSISYDNFYKQASVSLSGKTPGSTITKIGGPIIYGLTIPSNAPNKKAAIKFLEFFLGPEGQKIMKESGQEPIIPYATSSYANIPSALMQFAK